MLRIQCTACMKVKLYKHPQIFAAWYMFLYHTYKKNAVIEHTFHSTAHVWYKYNNVYKYLSIWKGHIQTQNWTGSCNIHLKITQTSYTASLPSLRMLTKHKVTWTLTHTLSRFCLHLYHQKCGLTSAYLTYLSLFTYQRHTSDQNSWPD